MSGKGKLALGLAWIILLCPLAFAQNHPPERSLAKKYVDWLNLVTYCITDQELEVFSKLTDDRDRDIFIDTFWKMRDPTPGTPENEYKEELIKRFEYVNKYFSRGTTRPGWQTDMGKVYMILGPPASTETFGRGHRVAALVSGLDLLRRYQERFAIKFCTSVLQEARCGRIQVV